MPWSVLLPLLLEVLKNRFDAGFPWLTKLLERFWGRVEEDVITVGAVATVGAAPEEIKTMLVELFTKLRDESKLWMKAVYTVLIKLVPQVADLLWDKLFAAGVVAKKASEFTAVVMGAAPQTEDELVAELLAA